jgi:hypothetical protein
MKKLVTLMQEQLPNSARGARAYLLEQLFAFARRCCSIRNQAGDADRTSGILVEHEDCSPCRHLSLAG